ncbi:MAG: DEAD/DEAH box helicase [Candidatus Aminicenantes bacterium]|nr:MAG: DEAD/DEAH box helicase [Candidatus Aminicenantes bacterium]
MIDKIFSPGLKRLITTKAPYTEINNIDKDLIELVIAGIHSLEKKHTIWVVGENQNLNEKKTKLELWLNLLNPDKTPIHFYTTPFEDPYINNEDNLHAVGHKTRLIPHLLESENQPLIIITTLSALNIKIENKALLRDFFIKIGINQTITRDELIKKLMNMGYHSRNIVEEKGDISWRGSIVDVFPIDVQHPVRIEIEGDTIVSLRIFDTDTQKSLERIQTINLPLSRFFLDYETNRDYFNGNKTNMNRLTDLLTGYKIVVSDKKKVIDEFNKLLLNYEKIYDAALGSEKKIEKPSHLFDFSLDKEDILSINETWDTISSPMEWVKLKKSLIDLNLEDLQYINEKVKNNGNRCFIFSKDEKLSESLAESFTTFTHIQLKIPFSFENQETKCIFLADRNFQYIEKIERTSQLKSEGLIKEIQLNDLVVHQEQGIGRFVGFKRLTFENQITEFLKIQYLHKEYLYVPVYEVDVLSKYIAFEGYMPKIDRLGGNTWALKKKRAKKSIITFARELLELYAMRKAIKGNAYTKDYELEEKLEEEFQYVETEDQKKAINEVLIDLEAEYPMDRLICGDVSFGKTEVALRAALRVVANGKQAALLCPTTILAFQHYHTFKQRFAQFPITIAMLSRMVSQKKKKNIYHQLANGKIDIIIATHALISRDITFKRLGLYIIDEEQRFGVFQKEKLKKNREDIDVLSMSATPIPRTLSFSMAGLQDISTIQTPPIGRLSIKNFVGYFSKEIIVSAVINEVERNGSVFIVYNNIDKIYSFQEEFQQWLPQISSLVIHAKMKSNEIETNLMDFINKRCQVLISTTIIENGIDIPDVNTLIVLDAHRFGLTQLYQLRGRIGRGNRQAYAYFLVKTMNISDKARARLEAIREFAELGAGYKLAEFDLKLRGAGTLLGNRQHGHIEALGFDYYHQMLVKTIKEMKGEMEKEKESKINIHFSYSIDPDYIKNTGERISLYREILEAENIERIEEMRVELQDRYGRPPDSIEKIFFAGVIRVLAKTYQLEEVDLYLDKLVVKFPGNREGMKSLIDRLPVSGAVAEVKIIDEEERVWAFHFSDYQAFIENLVRCAHNLE